MSSWELRAIRAGSPLQERTKAWLRYSIISAAAEAAAAAAGSLREGCGDCLVYSAFLLVTASVILSAQPTKLFPANSVKWQNEREHRKVNCTKWDTRGFLSCGVGFASSSGAWGNSRTAFNPETRASY